MLFRSIKQADENDTENLKEISNLIISYQAQSPTYAPGLPENVSQIKNGYASLAKLQDSIVLLAYKDNKLLGFQYGDTEDDLLSNMMKPEKAIEISVGGTAKESQGMGIGSILTKEMFNRASELGFENAITDWRIANLSSSNFWPKQGFKPIAYRMFRQIDERVLWAAHSYMCRNHWP